MVKAIFYNQLKIWNSTINVFRNSILSGDTAKHVFFLTFSGLTFIQVVITDSNAVIDFKVQSTLKE